MASFLVTGGAGFVGSNICFELLKQGHDVTVVDDVATGNIENIKPIIDKLEFINASICNTKQMKNACKDVDFVFHQAAIPSVPRSVKEPLLTSRVNINGTLNVLIAARDAGVKKVVYASSSSVYGDSPTLPKKESMKTQPLSPYAAAKLTGEYYCRMFNELYGMETASLRYFNVFGARQDPSSEYAAVIPKFIRLMAAGKQPTIFGDGKQSRDFTYIENVVNANLLCTKTKLRGESVNVAAGERITILELVEKLNKLLNKNIKPKFAKPRSGDIKHSLADISLAKKKLGYEPMIGFDDGIRKTVEWFT